MSTKAPRLEDAALVAALEERNTVLAARVGRLKRALRLVVIGYAVLALGVCAALFASWLNARHVEQARRERISQLNQINISQCESLRNVYSVIQQTLVESDNRINELDYYKHHPAERINAHHANAAIIQRFKTPPCPGKIKVSNP